MTAADSDSVTVTGVGVDVGDVPTDDTNIAMRAAHLLGQEHGLDRPVEIRIEKSIPVAGGMAGGSTDAAATLLACDLLWELHRPREELLELAAELGSDVPFCLQGGTALGSGRGELVTPVMTRGSYWWVIVPGADGLSTPAVYEAFDRIHADRVVSTPHVPEQMLSALRSGNLDLVGDWLGNDLQGAALALRPELSDVLQVGLDSTAHGALLSGSGPTTLFLAASRTHAALIEEGLRAELDLDRVVVAPAPVPGAHVVGVGR